MTIIMTVSVLITVITDVDIAPVIIIRRRDMRNVIFCRRRRVFVTTTIIWREC